MLGQLAKSGRTSKSGTSPEFLAIDRCVASAKSINEKTGGGVSTAALTMYADGVGDVSGSCFVPPPGGGGL